MTFYALEEVISCCKASLKHACLAEGRAVGNDARRSWQWCSPLPVVWADGVAGARFRFAGTRGFARWVHALALRIVVLHTAKTLGFARWVHALALRIVAQHTARAPGFARWVHALASRIVVLHTVGAPGFARRVNASHG
jgi:hypothetical protein